LRVRALHQAPQFAVKREERDPDGESGNLQVANLRYGRLKIRATMENREIDAAVALRWIGWRMMKRLQGEEMPQRI
ncbi:MAG TPA: hypothetical protein VN673_09470, partial [Clostridia bacterium]|nr:hypothetical protein [Clostridia bacterium]